MTLLTVVMHMSRTERPAGVPPYKPASAVILAEFGKLLASLVLAYRECKTAIKQERTRARLFPRLFNDGGAGVQKSPSTPHSSRKTAPPPPISEEQNKSPLSASSLLPAGQINSASSSPMTRQSSSQSSWQSASTDNKSKLSSSPSYSSLDGARDHEDAHTYPSTPPRRGSLVNPGSGRSATSPGKQQRLSLSGTPLRDNNHNQKRGEEKYDYAEKIHEEDEENEDGREEEDQKITREEIIQRMKEDTFGHDWLKLSIPAFLFTGQSNLSYYASSNLSVPVFQITYQLKIPATALCSVLMLNRALSRMQWAAIVLLSVGVGIVQLASSSVDKAHHSHTPDTSVHEHLFLNNSTSDPLLGARSHVIVARDAVVAAATEHVEMNQMLGLIAVVLACMSSGFSGVFFERQLKKAPTPIAPTSPDLSSKSPSDELSSSPSSYSSLILPSPPITVAARKTGLWIRNIQLSLFSLLVGSSIYALTSSRTDISNFLIGFTPLVWFVVFVQIVGGLVAAVVIQYADNIAKSFSASCSIILSFAVSIAFFDFQLSTGVVVGSTAVMVATWLFNASAPKPSSSSLINTGGNNTNNNNSYLPVSQNTSPIRQQQSKLDQYHHHHHHSHSHSHAHQRNPSVPAGGIGNPGKTPDVSLFAQSGSGFSGLEDNSNTSSAVGSRRGSPFPWAGPRQS